MQTINTNDMSLEHLSSGLRINSADDRPVQHPDRGKPVDHSGERLRGPQPDPGCGLRSGNRPAHTESNSSLGGHCDVVSCQLRAPGRAGSAPVRPGGGQAEVFRLPTGFFGR